MRILKGSKAFPILCAAAACFASWLVAQQQPADADLGFTDTPILPGQNQSTITITVFGNKAVHSGPRGQLIVTATMKLDKTTVFGYVPVIPYEVQ